MTTTARKSTQPSAALAIAEEEVEQPRLRPWPRYQRAALGFRNYWYPALLSRDLGRRPAPVKLLGEELVLVRRDGEVYCLQARCAHRGVPLAAGRFEFPCTITCVYHGWTYDLRTGKLVAALTDGPESSVVGKVKLKTYPAQERQGAIWVYIGDEDPAPPLERDIPKEFLEPGAVVWPANPKVRKGNWRMGIEGGLDPSHSYYMHRLAPALFFSRLPAHRGRHWVEREGRYITYRTEPPTMVADYPGLGRWPRQAWWQRPSFVVPQVMGFLPCGVVVDNFPASKVNSFNWHVPVDADHWRNFQFQVTWVTGLRKWWFKFKHLVWWGPFIQWLFLNQDRWAAKNTTEFYNEHDGWEKERMFRPDVMITGWRKFVEENDGVIQEPSRAD